MRRVLLALLLSAPLFAGCASVDVVRLQPDLLLTPKGTQAVAGIQAVCSGFYLFTLGIPEADLDKVINELLLKEARKIGADRVIDLRFEATPSDGIWWLTKLLGFRSARASGIAVITEEKGLEGSAPLLPPPPPAGEPPSGPAQE